MSHVLYKDDAVIHYPVTRRLLSKMYTNTEYGSASVPEDITLFRPVDGAIVAEVQPTEPPASDKTWEISPILEDGVWVMQWEGRSFTEDEIAQNIAALKSSIDQQVEKRLDTFASTRGYTNMDRACGYGSDPDPQFSVEGTYCLKVRGETWRKCYQMLDEVEAGTRPMPADYADIEPELPTLEWPA